MSYHGPDYSRPSEIDALRRFAIFEDEDINAYRLEQDYLQFEAKYTKPLLGSPHPRHPDYYCTGDTNKRPTEIVKICRFTRTWHQLPDTAGASGIGGASGGTRVVPLGTLSYQLPGIQTSDSLILQYYASAFSISGGILYLTDNEGLFNVDQDDLAVGKLATVNYQFYNGTDNIPHPRSRTLVVRYVSTRTIGVDYWQENGYVVYDTFQKAATKRSPITKNLMAWDEFDYYLPGVTPNINTVSDIPRLNSWKILDMTTSSETDTLSELTDPDIDEYLLMVANHESVIVESVIEPWQGNIYQRRTRRVELE